MLSKECSSKPLHLGFPESPPAPEFWSARVCKYLLILTFAPFCSCWLPSSCLVPTWTTICICCCPLSWSCLMPLKFHCHLESKPLPVGLTVIKLLTFSWKCPFLKLPGCLPFFCSFNSHYFGPDMFQVFGNPNCPHPIGMYVGSILPKILQKPFLPIRCWLLK